MLAFTSRTLPSAIRAVTKSTCCSTRRHLVGCYERVALRTLVTKASSPMLPPVLPPLPDAASLKENAEGGGVFGGLLEQYSLTGNAERALMAELFFRASTVQSSNPQWFGPNRLEKDFRRQHALLSLHVWLLHKKLLNDHAQKDAALLVDEELFNIFWEDTICRIREQGVYELSVYKNLNKVQQYTWVHLTNYDHIYSDYLDKPKERMEELYKLIARHFLMQRDFDEDGAPPPKWSASEKEFLDRMAWYIEANYQNIMYEWPEDCYRESRVAWVNLPFEEDLPLNAEDVLPEPWQSNITVKGIIYYWNPETMESSWEKPTK